MVSSIIQYYTTVLSDFLTASNYSSLQRSAMSVVGGASHVTCPEHHRRITPTHHVLFLQHVSTLDISLDKHSDTQTMVDEFYRSARELLDRFYPERTITVSSRDPDFVTASIKARLRRRNKLMRVGRIEEADVLTVRIGKEIKQRKECA